MPREAAGSRDPDLLQIIGHVSNFLGATEFALRIHELQRRNPQHAHEAIERAWNAFASEIEVARQVLADLRATIPGSLAPLPPGTIAVSLAERDFIIFRDSIQRLHRSVGTMTESCYELESLTHVIASEAERFYKISQLGRPVLRLLQRALAGEPESLAQLLVAADRYLVQAGRVVTERDDWMNA